MLLLLDLRRQVVQARMQSQSPIHRECFCYLLGRGGLSLCQFSRNPLFIGNAFATENDIVHPCGCVTSRNPLFIGNAFATRTLYNTDVWLAFMSQSPIHRECFCYNAIFLAAIAALKQVAIPYSSGMLLLPVVGQHTPLLTAGLGGSGRNPLFIGNAFATP